LLGNIPVGIAQPLLPDPSRTSRVASSTPSVESSSSVASVNPSVQHPTRFQRSLRQGGDIPSIISELQGAETAMRTASPTVAVSEAFWEFDFPDQYRCMDGKVCSTNDRGRMQFEDLG